jgi:hypothetical protein
MTEKKTQFSATLKAFASIADPHRTIVELILTDFLPNKNKQCIPETEAENILASALGMPLKIKLTEAGEEGHAGSYPIGVLQKVFLRDNKVFAECTIWPVEFPEEDTYLRSATAEGRELYTSWEVFYEESYYDTENIEYLKGVRVSATTIVKNPAYGQRTPILSIAETDQLMTEEEIQALRDEITARSNQVLALYDVLNTLWYDLAEVEELENRAAVFTDEEDLIARVTEMQSMITKRKEELQGYAERVTSFEKAEAERLEKVAEAERIATRKSIVTGLKATWEDEYATMSEDRFLGFIDGLKKIPAIAEVKSPVPLPEPYGSLEPVTIGEIADHFKQKKVIK